MTFSKNTPNTPKLHRKNNSSPEYLKQHLGEKGWEASLSLTFTLRQSGSNQSGTVLE